MNEFTKEKLIAILQDLRTRTVQMSELTEKYNVNAAALGTLNRIKHLVSEADLIDSSSGERKVVETEVIVMDKSQFDKLDKKVNCLYLMLKDIRQSVSGEVDTTSQRLSIKHGVDGTIKVWYRKGIQDDEATKWMELRAQESQNGKMYYAAKRYRCAVSDGVYSVMIMDAGAPIEIVFPPTVTKELAEEVNLVNAKVRSCCIFFNPMSLALIFEDGS